MPLKEELSEDMLNGEQVYDSEPKSRFEEYLMSCCDKSGCDNLPEPRSRVGALLYRLAEQLSNEGAGKEGADGKTPYIQDGYWYIDGVNTNVKAEGIDGKDGYTPIKGVDYYTDKEKGEFSKYITFELAKRGQLKPEFANSIEECTDTSKLYVLPDGYIYAYMFKEGSGTTATFTNQIPRSTDTDGSVYDGDGYADGSYLSSSGGVSTKAGCVVSGFIPYTGDKPIYFKGTDLVSTSTYTRINLYDTSKTKVGNMTQTGKGDNNVHLNYNFEIVAEGDYFKMMPKNLTASFSGIAFIRISCEFGITGDEWIVTVDEPITYTVDEGGYSWRSTGHAFVPTDYEDRIIELEENVAEHATRLMQLESDDTPAYWLNELKTKADAIRLAMETAGRNKSSFLWYTDSHWTYGNAKISPMLLKYLWGNTPINKVNFGGDIVVNAQGRDEMQYVYNEWRNAIRELPNHHSVIGNHDLMIDYPYTFMIAPEESADIVMGDGMYYYIDNPCEKTRYLYLEYIASSNTEAIVEQGAFIVNALMTTPDGWHIIVIAHRWFQYNSGDAPTVGAIPNYIGEILRVFDVYNVRGIYPTSTHFEIQDFSNCGGKVEFCIGGHIHVDYDLTSDGGIPIIMTASDTNQDRSSYETEDSGTLGTITESAIYGIIADYNSNKITIVGVGRGESRVITY